MSSNIDTSSINTQFPVQGTDNPSQGFRDNFFNIAAQLDVAASEITELQNNVPSAANVLPTFTTATVTATIGVSVGTLVFVTDAPGGAQPCYYDGTNWYTVTDRTQI